VVIHVFCQSSLLFQTILISRKAIKSVILFIDHSNLQYTLQDKNLEYEFFLCPCQAKRSIQSSGLQQNHVNYPLICKAWKSLSPLQVRFYKSFRNKESPRDEIVCSNPVKCEKVELYSERGSNNKEKEVDTTIVSDVVHFAGGVKHVDCSRGKKCICPLLTPDINRETCQIVILTGDRDMCPAVQSALDYGWFVDVAAFPLSLSPEFDKRFGGRPRFHLIKIQKLNS
jgi:hypothetical protein